MIEVMPALDGIAVVRVVVIGMVGEAGWRELGDNVSECEGERNVAAEGERTHTSSSSPMVATEATVTGCLSMPVLMPSCIFEPISGLEKRERRLDILRGGVETGEVAPSD